MATYLITGCSRGIGLELVQQILETYKNSKVIATARKPQESKELVALHERFPDNLLLLALDIDSTESVKNAAQQISSSHPKGIDFLVNNAGIPGANTSDPDDMLQVLNTNVVGTLRVYQAFLPLVKKGEKKVIVQLASSLGSISRQGEMFQFLKLVPGSDFYSYRTSKAAVNCLISALAEAHKEEGIIFVLIHPGLVDTDMYRRHLTSELKDPPPALSKEQSVKGILEVVHKSTIADSGKFVRWDGEAMVW